MQNNQITINFIQFLEELYGESVQLQDGEFLNKFFEYSGYFRAFMDLAEEEYNIDTGIKDWNFSMAHSLEVKRQNCIDMCKNTLEILVNL